MFGENSARIPMIQVKANTWTNTNTWKRLNTYTQSALGTTPSTSVLLTNPTSAASGAQQVSPSVEWQGSGWSTVSGSKSINFRSYALGIQGTPSPSGSWRLESSIDGASYLSALEYLTTSINGSVLPQLSVNGSILSTFNNSNTIDSLQNLNLVSSGNRVNFAYTVGSTIVGGIQAINDGNISYFAAGTQRKHNFYSGSFITTQTLLAQIFQDGIYNGGGIYNLSDVTAGSADFTPNSTLNSYGSLSVKGNYVSAATYTISRLETVTYGDASAIAVCSGTPSAACSSYGDSSSCNAHSAAGCTWNPGTDCSTTFFDEASCNAQSGCSWATSSCGSFPDESSCVAQSGCTWNSSSCSAFDGDQASCESTSGCSWDSGSNTCTGVYATSCSGVYPVGPCNGFFGSSCSGTATCSSITSSGPCAAESGCSWVTAATYTLQTTSEVNKSNTARMHYIKNIGASGTINVVAGVGDTLESPIALTTGQRVLVHHHIVMLDCGTFSTESPCTSQTGCTWSPGIVCSDYTDEPSCTSNGCSWDGTSCSGAGTTGYCYGSYISAKKWFKLAS